MRVDLPSSTLPTVRNRSNSRSILKITLPFLQLHRSVLVVIDEPVLALRSDRGFQFLDDFEDGIRARSDRTGAVSASERTHPANNALWNFPRRHRRVVLHRDEHAATDQHLALLRKIERDHRNLLLFDISPHIQFGPVRKRKDAHAFAGLKPAVVKVPQFGALIARIPLAERIAKRVDTLLRPRALLLTSCATDGCIKPVLFQRIQKGLRFQQAATLADA